MNDETRCHAWTLRWPQEQCKVMALAPRVFCSHHETACAMCNRGMGPHLFRDELHQ